MLSFKDFLLLNEGGNVVIDQIEAQRIDLTCVSRQESVKQIDETLQAFNQLFEKFSGMPLWTKKLFDSRQFLSGSSYAFFQTDEIPDDRFVCVKPTVGDIDTQVDILMKSMIDKFLKTIKGKTVGHAKFVGYKASGEQFITLWQFESFATNVQVDLELVPFDSKTGFPTAWSRFSHASAWADMEQGLKGVFHKYALGALDAPKFKDMIVKAKTARGKDKIMNRGTHSFSVSHGIRKKMEPVYDKAGNIVYYEGLPQYRELSTKESTGNTDLEFIFNHFFGVDPSQQELEQMGSFVGLIELIRKHYKPADWPKIVEAFTRKLWGKGSQGLYRGDPQRDLNEKTHALVFMAERLSVNPKQFEQIKTEYYKSYK